MAEWNHRICERCWFDGPQTLIKNEDGSFSLPDERPIGLIDEGELTGAYRMPVENVEAAPGACCFCGGMTITGIFTRRDEKTLPCLGRHGSAQLSTWSRVGAR